MKKPDSPAALLAVIFGIAGVLLAGIGLWSMGWQGAGYMALVLFEAGVLILMAFGACMIWADALRRRWYKLPRVGTAAPAIWTRTVYHTSLPWGRAHPWSVLCGYEWNGREYTARSPLLWTQPGEEETAVIYLDPKHPGRTSVKLGEN